MSGLRGAAGGRPYSPAETRAPARAASQRRAENLMLWDDAGAAPTESSEGPRMPVMGLPGPFKDPKGQWEPSWEACDFRVLLLPFYLFYIFGLLALPKQGKHSSLKTSSSNNIIKKSDIL